MYSVGVLGLCRLQSPLPSGGEMSGRATGTHVRVETWHHCECQQSCAGLCCSLGAPWCEQRDGEGERQEQPPNLCKQQHQCKQQCHPRLRAGLGPEADASFIDSVL